MLFRFRFKPYQGVTKRIGEIMKGKFPGAWPTWGEVPIQQRDLWFAEFKVRTLCYQASCYSLVSCVIVDNICNTLIMLRMFHFTSCVRCRKRVEIPLIN